jgi:hypothetical protein
MKQAACTEAGGAACTPTCRPAFSSPLAPHLTPAPPAPPPSYTTTMYSTQNTLTNPPLPRHQYTTTTASLLKLSVVCALLRSPASSTAAVEALHVSLTGDWIAKACRVIDLQGAQAGEAAAGLAHLDGTSLAVWYACSNADRSPYKAGKGPGQEATCQAIKGPAVAMQGWTVPRHRHV